MKPNAKVNYYTINLPKSISSRPATSFNSPRSISTGLSNQNNKKMPYSGLSIGFLNIQRRPEEKNQTIQPTNYTHYFADMYVNSETISFPKIDNNTNVEIKEKVNFVIPTKCNFRRLKKKNRGEPRPVTTSNNHSTSFVERSAGRSYELQKKRKKELLPLTKLTAKKMQPEVLGLKIKKLVKPYD